jgi:hypothetical protein
MLKPESKPHGNEDPLLRSARREAAVAIVVWLAAMSYTVGYCWRYAYGRSLEEMRFIGGIPDWVLWGIVLPWAVCVLVCWCYAYGFMSDESLGEERDEPDELEP